jgi:hypothetical protein
MYCGNNSRNPSLLDGTKVIGNRRGCLKKGIGVGIHRIPLDLSYLQPYSPIDNRKIYCGNSGQLPPNYDLVGTLQQCYQIGVGVGKSIKARNHNEGKENKENQDVNMQFYKKPLKTLKTLKTLKPLKTPRLPKTPKTPRLPKPPKPPKTPRLPKPPKTLKNKKKN